ncbi:hypothetical protein [Azospirillum soli]|uniref:hypothetical protein n=1 Tax=Azospirillum soli TaxID=1304799 RepID=UPI001AE1368C|nr:hypothetical protein [Azospirillum soli]MBP2313761.1 hypothetical protein [Azospirillum soli]
MDTATDRMAKLRELSQHIGKADFLQVAERVAREVKAPMAEPAPVSQRMTGAPRRPATLPRKKA